MTNHWNDIGNSDVIMIIGSNAAENHPISFKYVQEAIDKGAKLIVVDPRYTKTAAKASYLEAPPGTKVQLYSKIRSGTDIAFMLGMMKYAIDNNRVNWQYLRDCTNASFLLNPGFSTCRNQNPHPDAATYPGGAYGIFSGLIDDPRRHKKYKYDTGTWTYQYANIATDPEQDNPLVDRGTGAWDDDPSNPGVITYLKGAPNPNSVWAKLIEQLSAYTIPNVSKITGALPAILTRIYHIYTSTCQDNKSACIMYAMGGTQHTYGSQNVRSYAMMQLLLGNTGVAGGGINALRGESNVQGSTDMCLLWHILPGYLNVTTNSWANRDRAGYKYAYSATGGRKPLDPTPGSDPVSLSWWKFGGKYIDSLLQAWWPVENMLGYDGTNAVAMQDTAYHYLPKADQNFWYTHE